MLFASAQFWDADSGFRQNGDRRRRNGGQEFLHESVPFLATSIGAPSVLPYLGEFESLQFYLISPKLVSISISSLS